MTEACELARLGIQERDFLIATHNRSESAIIAQATFLAQELHSAAAALDGLHDRSAFFPSARGACIVLSHAGSMHHLHDHLPKVPVTLSKSC